MENCFHCKTNPRSNETTNGIFCTVQCENDWVRACFSRLSGDECLDLMGDVITKTEAAAEAKKNRERMRAVSAGK